MHNALHSGQVLSIKLIVTCLFLSKLTSSWLWLTPAWPLTPAMHCTLLWGSSDWISSHRTFLCKLISDYPQVTPAWSRDDPSSALHFILSTKFGSSYNAFLRQTDLWITFDLRLGHFENNALKPRGPVPYPHAKFQLNTPNHNKTHSHPSIHTYILTHIILVVKNEDWYIVKVNLMKSIDGRRAINYLPRRCRTCSASHPGITIWWPIYISHGCFGTAIQCEIARLFPRSIVKVGLNVQCKNFSSASGVQPWTSMDLKLPYFNTY